ncbi:MAG: hypothetical protein ABTR92_14210 [Candidatus Accumulibacter phosphatis]
MTFMIWAVSMVMTVSAARKPRPADEQGDAFSVHRRFPPALRESCAGHHGCEL